MDVKIREIRVKSIITKSNLPDSDYVVNPYVGCQHSCIYCYARFMKRFTNHKEPWGRFLDVKINAPNLVPQNTKKYRIKTVFLSSVTDPYLPLERKYQLTRKILKRLVLHPHLGIQTKSDLVLRDIDILKQFKNCEVGLTITTLDDKIRREIEPYTSPVERRISALKKLKKEGISTYVFIGPIMPFFTDWKAIVKRVQRFVDCIMFENLSLRGDIAKDVFNWLEKKHPEYVKKYRGIYFSKSSFWDDMEKEIGKYGKRNSLDFRIYFHHGK